MAEDTQFYPGGSRTIITNLLSSIPEPDHSRNQTGSNPLDGVSPETKNLLLTLHILFPNEFLPALDVLDRRLLTRFTIRSAPAPAPTPAAPSPAVRNHGAESSKPTSTPPDDVDPPPTTPPALFFVRSAQPARPAAAAATAPTTSRFHDPLATHYEVRPLAWNCSCPAFAFSAYPVGDEGEGDAAAWTAEDARTQEAYDAQWRSGGGGEDWQFGGLGLGGTAPLCKHLLACVLAERVALFRGMVEEKEVSAQELAGWAAGWGG